MPSLPPPRAAKTASAATRRAVPDSIRRAQRRSDAMHAAIALRLRREPELLDVARQFVARELGSADPGRAYWARAWQAWLDGPLPALLDFLADDSEHARRMRKSGPFAGVLPARERWAIWRASGG